MQPAVPPFARLILSLCLAAAFAEVHADPQTDVRSVFGQPASGKKAQKPSQPVRPQETPPFLFLQPSTQLSKGGKGEPSPGPNHLEADSIEGHTDREVVAQGRVVLRNLREHLEADWLRYDREADEAEARGNIVLTRDRDRIEGSSLKLKLTPRLGAMQDVRYELYSDDGRRARGAARTLAFAGIDKYRLDEAVYTTCPAGNQDWQLKVEELDLDYVGSLGSGRQVRLEYLDVPILYSPWMDFALDDRRKSGFLAPTYGVSDQRGLELLVPWYWNIAPNRDLTFLPRLMTKRGLQLGGDFRYLERGYAGEVGLALLPNDQVADRSRYQMSIRHAHTFDPRWSARLDYERVSDDTYFADLSSLVNQTSRVNLPQKASLAYDGGWWKAAALLQGFQTLQDPDPAKAIAEPYQRLPQITLSAFREPFGGQFKFSGEYDYFNVRKEDRVQGSRLHLQPGFAFPLQTTYSTVTPRLGWYLTGYALDDATRNKPDSVATGAPAGGFADATRSLPVFSLDANLQMERDTMLAGQDFIQTLEPRAFYVYIPYRNQDRLPVFDSSLSELSLDQLFTENQFTGIDRINNANQLTLAVTSRFLDRGTGAERMQVTFGQRYYFEDQRVCLAPCSSQSGGNTTDLIAAVGGQITSRWRVGAGVQVNTSDGDLVKANLSGAFRDGPGKVFNANYRYTQDPVDKANSLNQVDLSGQWPLAPKWYGVGRVNYSFKDSRLVEGLMGLEYNAGCWSLRGVMQQLATTDSTATSAFFLQLELRGLTKLGPNPLDVLKRSISGYAKSDDFDPLQ